jgi:hypothetical protein
MATSEMIHRTELLLRAQIAQRPVSLRGVLEQNGLSELSGRIKLQQSLSSLLSDLGESYTDAAEALTALLGNSDLDVVLQELGVVYRTGSTKQIQLGLLLTIGSHRLQFALLKNVGVPGYLVGLDVTVNTAHAPTNFLSGLVGDISIGKLGVYYASEAFNNVSVFTGDDFQNASVLTSSRSVGTSATFPQGLKVISEISIGGLNLLDYLATPRTAMPTPEPPPAFPRESPAKAKQVISAGMTVWIDAQKTIGPLLLRRVGLSYLPSAKKADPARIGIKLDAGLQLSFLTATLEGVGLTYPLKAPKSAADVWDNLRFGLDGASVMFSGGPLTIGGGLLKVDVPEKPEALQLDGSLLVGIDGLFTITALGSYANINGTTSLFLFAALQRELGGPPCFFVTGLALGFGINRALKLPAIEEVANFPLIKAATDPTYLGKNLDLRAVSQKLGEYIYPSVGNYWGAAGVKFTSFGLIDAFAMVTVSYGTQLQIALLGLATITIPKQLGANPLPPIASAELAIKVAFNPAEGIFAAEARLTDNSFLFTKECRLRGGFAFYLWFHGPHAGDFVVTLGGYHARFKKPDHYPVVPRVRIDWPISTALTITGEAYFALTPSCLMAGGRLDIVFQAGPIRAWFHARADFLIAWQPFSYDIDIAVRIGIAFQTDMATLTFEVGASVHLWGPPFGGLARVSLVIVSFDIPLGEQEPAPPEPLTWNEFQQSFLPPSQPGSDPVLNTIRIINGLLTERDIGEQERKKTIRVVNAQAFTFMTESVIPSTTLALNNIRIGDGLADAPALGIRPMGKTALQSEHKVTIWRRSNDQAEWGAKYVASQLIRKNVPSALWSNDLTPLRTPTADMIKEVPSGLRISMTLQDPYHALSPIDLLKFRYDNFEQRIPWRELTTTEIPAPKANTLQNTIWNNAKVSGKRRAILQALGKTDDRETVMLEDFAVNAGRILQAMPEMACLGEAMKGPQNR